MLSLFLLKNEIAASLKKVKCFNNTSLFFFKMNSLTVEKMTSLIIKPTLFIEKSRAKQNIKKMMEKAHRSNISFRPHFKTHQSAAIGEWFRDFGVEAITVSSVEMASYFADHGWNDITIAFPVNVREIAQINLLAQQINLGLLVESIESVAFLEATLLSPADVWLKVDVGYHRTGTSWDDVEAAFSIIEKMKDSRRLNFAGLLTHSGHAYHADSLEKIRRIYDETVARLQSMKLRLGEKGVRNIELSLGDTPSCSLVHDFSGVDEIRPGNFVFYDAMQLNLGVCEEADIAVVVACPIVAKHASRGEIVIYGGAIHLSKERIVDRNGDTLYGYIALMEEKGWGSIIPGAFVSCLSQEHGVVRMPDSILNKLNIGDLIAVIPVHSCLTANLLRYYLATEGAIIPTMLTVR